MENLIAGHLVLREEIAQNLFSLRPAVVAFLRPDGQFHLGVKESRKFLMVSNVNGSTDGAVDILRNGQRGTYQQNGQYGRYSFHEFVSVCWSFNNHATAVCDKINPYFDRFQRYRNEANDVGGRPNR